MMWRYLARCFSDCRRCKVVYMRVRSNEVYLIQRHEFFCRVLFILTERRKLDIIWGSRFISEGWLQSIQVVGTNGNKLAPPTKILVQLILKVYEGRIGSWREFDVSKNSASKKGPNPTCLGRHLSVTWHQMQRWTHFGVNCDGKEV